MRYMIEMPDNWEPGNCQACSIGSCHFQPNLCPFSQALAQQVLYYNTPTTQAKQPAILVKHTNLENQKLVIPRAKTISDKDMDAPVLEPVLQKDAANIPREIMQQLKNPVPPPNHIIDEYDITDLMSNLWGDDR